MSFQCVLSSIGAVNGLGRKPYTWGRIQGDGPWSSDFLRNEMIFFLNIHLKNIFLFVSYLHVTYQTS